MNSSSTILVLNAGSSSVKFALFGDDEPSARSLSGAVDGIGHDHGHFRAVDAAGGILSDEEVHVSNQEGAIEVILSAVEGHPAGRSISIVGHRVAHGGPNCDCPRLVTPELESELQERIPLAPLHLPHNLAGIAAVRSHRPKLPQVACFDTAFHASLPKLAQTTGLPRDLISPELRRYGYHGLSYEFVVDDLRRKYGPQADSERLIVAHLGNGASMAAIRDGRSIETTMGFSTLSGLPMGTRSGDIDPGLVLYLILEKGLSAEAVRQVLYERSGLLGLSGISSDMRVLLADRDRPQAAEAIDYFCTHARSFIGSLSTTLGGLDRIVFTGGIGANAPTIRAKVCADLEYLGVELDDQHNASGARLISSARSRVNIEAFSTDEEIIIARHARQVLDTQLAVQG